MVQGNVNFLFLNLILHMYFWLSIQRISLTFYGYLLHVWYILFIYFCFWLGTLTWTSFPINCLWNCSNLNHNTNVNFHYSIHVWTTLMLLLYLWLSFQRISLTFYGHVLYIPVYFTGFWLGTRAWTSLPKNCFWNCYKTQSKYQWVNWNPTYVEKI